MRRPGTGSVAAAVPLLLVVGFASIIFLTTGNSTIQLLAEPSYRGPDHGALVDGVCRQHADRRNHHRRDRRH